MVSSKYQIIQPLLLAIILSIGLVVGYSLSETHADFSIVKKTNQLGDISLGVGRVEDVIRVLENNYVDDLPYDQMIEESIENMLTKLDPFSQYLNPEEYADYNEKIEGIYRGIGIESVFIGDTMFVSHVTENSPAAQSGLLPGCKILYINEDTIIGADYNITKVSKLIKSQDKDHVRLGIQNKANDVQYVDVGIKNINRPSANVGYMINENSAYLKISRFSANTYDQVFKTLELISDENGKRPFNLILDLRNNPGGYLPQALKILSQLFSEKDKILTYTIGEHRNRKEYRSTGRNFFDINKMVVLINNYSASASEIVAGAIQDWDRGILIGETSYGKGLVQEIFQLKNGGAIKLTVARYFTPSGRQIQKPYSVYNDSIYQTDELFKTKLYRRKIENNGGITPDYIVKPNFPDYDDQYTSYVSKFILPYVDKISSSDLSTNPGNSLIDKLQPYISLIKQAKGIEIDNELLRAELIYSWYGSLEYNKFKHKKDNLIEKGLEQLSFEEPVQKLVSNEF